MMVACIEGAARHIGASQGYEGLPVRDELVNCTVNGPRTPCMTTARTPTPQELAALLAGASVHVCILGTAHPPITVSVRPPLEG